MKFILLSAVLVLSGISFSSYADEFEVNSTLTKYKKAASSIGIKINTNKDEPIRIEWPDGRVAESFSEISQLRLKIPITISENLCRTDAPKIKCTLITSLETEKVSMKWVKHSDAAKINQIVNLSGDDFTVNMNWYKAQSSFAPQATADIPPDQIECEDWSWAINGSPNQAPSELDMAVFQGDFNFLNLTTGLNVNQGFAGNYDVHWKRITNQILEVDSYGPMFSIFGSGVPIYAGFSMDAQIRDQEKICQVTFIPEYSIQKIASMIQDIKPQIVKPLIVGESDTYINLLIHESESIVDLIEVIKSNFNSQTSKYDTIEKTESK